MVRLYNPNNEVVWASANLYIATYISRQLSRRLPVFRSRYGSTAGHLLLVSFRVCPLTELSRLSYVQGRNKLKRHLKLVAVPE
jgi:hypothetical protein